MPKKKVLLVTKLYAPWIGGVEKHVQDLAESLQEDFDIEILCCQEPGGISGTHAIGGIKVHKVPSLGIYFSMPVALAFPSWLKRLSEEADIVHFHLPFPLAVISHRILSTLTRSHAHTRKRILVTWHSDIVRQKTLAKLFSSATHALLHEASTIIATSRSLIKSSQTLRRFEGKCQVIPLSIHLEDFALNDERRQRVEEIRKKYGKLIVLFVGRLVPYKGARYLIEAMTRLSFETKLLLIGEGPLEAELKALSRSLKLEKRVFFLGAQDGESLISYFHACDVFALPSITPNEAFGIVQMEAMACGKPVINTSLETGVPEVSVHNETGFTVPPANSKALSQALSALLTDVDLREKFGKAAAEKARVKFDSKIVAQKIAFIYR